MPELTTTTSGGGQLSAAAPLPVELLAVDEPDDVSDDAPSGVSDSPSRHCTTGAKVGWRIDVIPPPAPPMSWCPAPIIRYKTSRMPNVLIPRD